MNWFTLGCQEVRQKAFRLSWRITRRLDERRLVKAETTLGELGWQQADFPEHVEETIGNLHRIESEQAELFNRSADLAGEMTAAQKERDDKRAAYDRARATVVTEMQPHLTAREKEEQARVPLQHLTTALREQQPELREQERDYRRQIENLVNQPLSGMDLMQERQRLLDLHQATLSSISAAHDGMEKACADIRVHDEAIARINPIIAALQQHIEILDQQFSHADRERADLALKLQQEKSGVERRLSELDHSKGNEFLIVGRCLADAQIPPMNQPQALQKVLDLRGNVARLEAAVATSLAWSEAQEMDELKKFYFAVGIAMGLVILVVCVSLRATGH
ncbi:MAG: hypothetical protein QM796_16990 [Chthoniobacteraceae bacterium]